METKETMLAQLPLLPLRGVLVFPHMVIHLDVGREKSVQAVETAMAGNKLIFLAMQKEARDDEPELDEIYQAGTVAEIKQLLKLPGGTIRILVEGLYRGKVKEVRAKEPYLLVDVLEQRDETMIDNETEALMRSLVDMFEKYVRASKKVPPETVVAVVSIEDPGHFADAVAAQLNIKLADKQSIIAETNVAARLRLLLELLANELQVLELEKKINAQVRKQMEQAQKEYYLREQIKAIQKELGDKEDREAEAEDLRSKIEKARMPKEVKEKALKEVERLEKMPPMVAEVTVIRTYLDWLLALPWSKETKDRLDLTQAEETLEKEHYGLKDAKERILEYLAVRQLAQKLRGPIICFVGPPGVGKTSLAKSIASALGRKFVRISLGGVRDEAEIRGHRRTYVGALPGRIIQGMKQAGTRNPVFLLDEIDKINSDFRGDPASALLEVLDPEQNFMFSDHYLEVPFDLSKVMFITTANVMYNIPRPLLDRMEVIELPGYTDEEKFNIAVRHLWPKQLKEHGLQKEQIELSDNVVRRLIREYTREAGVRNLERELATICRKVVRELVAGKATTFKVTAQNLDHYLGIPRYRHTEAEKEDQVGVATGLAVTEAGGDVLSVEVSVMPGKGNLTLTGKLGDVMKESAWAAFSYIRSRAAELAVSPTFHETSDVHIHVPEGAIPKDGPSAGLTMTVALISALTGKAVKSEVAMTGEITLRGRILAVGGIKEKVLAAYRAGSKVIILPKENEKNLKDIPDNVKRKLKVVLADHLDQVLPVVFRES